MKHVVLRSYFKVYMCVVLLCWLMTVCSTCVQYMSQHTAVLHDLRVSGCDVVHLDDVDFKVPAFRTSLTFDLSLVRGLRLSVSVHEERPLPPETGRLPVPNDPGEGGVGGGHGVWSGRQVLQGEG